MKVAILGTVGVPAQYGGFETLAENLVRYSDQHIGPEEELTVYCSAKVYPERLECYHRASLRYSRFSANGAQSVLYDVLTALDAAARGHDRLLILGVSGGIVIPFLRLISRAVIITNVDGIEWRREKWQGFARFFLKWSEALAVRYSHTVIADNQGIADHLKETYGIEAEVIAYGGDHALLEVEHTIQDNFKLPDHYGLALCRIEPENNVDLILEAFDDSELPLVFVGNWSKSNYGRILRERYHGRPGIHLLDPIYDAKPLYALRRGASVYVHGHSAGGTNPSLVEMMHFGVPVAAYDCVFNRHTTENEASYFRNTQELKALLKDSTTLVSGIAMQTIAVRRYRWDVIGENYFTLLRGQKCS